MKRRFHLIPFIHKPDVSKLDKKLKEKLQPEWPGILAWMIDGCFTWQSSGLMPPASVVEATQEYFSEQDHFREWLDDYCDLDPNHVDTIKNLFASWREFAQRQHIFQGNATNLSLKLKKLSNDPEMLKFQIDRMQNIGEEKARGFRGIRVRPGTETKAKGAEVEKLLGKTSSQVERPRVKVEGK